jgi:outer membrane biosynthesis protein TonB
LLIDPDGTLKEAEVIESPDPRLSEAVLEGTRSAAPFPRFPKTLKISQARYEFIVQYLLE